MKSYIKLAAVLSVILAVSVFSLPSARASETAVAVQAPDQTAIQTISPEKKMKKEKKKTIQKQTKKNVQTEPASTEKGDVHQTGQSSGDEGLAVYDPAKDAAPAEGLTIEETNFHFREPLLVPRQI